MQYCSLRYFTLSNAKKCLLIKGGKGLTGPIYPSLFLNPFSPRPTQTNYFVILLCLDNARQLSLVKGEPLGEKNLLKFNLTNGFKISK